MHAVSAGPIGRPPAGAGWLAGHPADIEAESLFDRFSWVYAFCREHLFRDHTEQIVAALWAEGTPPMGARLLELGCGPGFYACRLAEHFEDLRVVGVDRSEEQLRRARVRAAARRLANCRFEEGDALALAQPSRTVDAVVASRLFTVLPRPARALAEMHRVLRPGGRCFVAEPRSWLGASVPLLAMWLLASLAGIGGDPSGRYREPSKAAVLSAGEFGGLIASQPWGGAWLWHDAEYQYAVCEKGGGSPSASVAGASAAGE